MAIHQCAQFCNNLYVVHKWAVRGISNYLANTSTYVDLPDGNWRLTACGVVYKINIGKAIECYVYAEYAGGWSQEDVNNA